LGQAQQFDRGQDLAVFAALAVVGLEVGPAYQTLLIDEEVSPVGVELLFSTAPPANRSKSCVKQTSSFVHVPVKASGKNASNTLVLPRKDDRDTEAPAVDGAVKSGATSPTCGEYCSSVLVIHET